MTAPLGDRASFLLGMLLGAPRSADELHLMIGRLVEEGVADLVDEAEDLSPGLPAALAALYDAGPDEVRRLLDRLVEFGFADSVALDGSAIYVHRTLRS